MFESTDRNLEAGAVRVDPDPNSFTPVRPVRPIAAVGGAMFSAMVLFIEDAIHTTYTGKVAIPAGAFVHNVEVVKQAPWGAESALMNVGDGMQSVDGFAASVNCKLADTGPGQFASVMHIEPVGAKKPRPNVVCVDGGDVVGVITAKKPGTDVRGRTLMIVTYSLGEVVDAGAS